ncbi:MAG: ion transporter [Alphaproteobacteria bacterium]|nr:ion transporter [Alphaproteobacteria bacterium]
MQSAVPQMTSWRARVFAIVEASAADDWRGRIFNVAMVALILANVAAVIVETVPSIAVRHDALFEAFETASVAVFTVEYLLRLWTCVEGHPLAGDAPWRVRLRYAVSMPSLIDLAAILPFYLAMWVSFDLRILRVLRLLRLLKLTRYSPALETFGAVLYSQRRPLMAAGIVILAMLVFSSSVVYLLEREGQPETFGSIPAAMWWAMATLSTVGYGDVTPHTPLGKLFGGVVMIIGIGMFTLPTGIMATGFATELRKRDFVVSWGLVAKVPLFSRLDAVSISEIVTALTPKLVPPRYVIVHQGETANDMYFIVSGEVEVVAPGGVIKLAGGDFFGEIALLAHVPRTATVMAVTECHLLRLNKRDFQHLLDHHDDLRQELEQVMSDRLVELKTAQGAEDGAS